MRANETLRRLVSLGLLEKRGGGSATHYVPTLRAGEARPERGLFDDVGAEENG